jgi:hypothetical protein
VKYETSDDLFSYAINKNFSFLALSKLLKLTQQSCNHDSMHNHESMYVSFESLVNDFFSIRFLH